MNNKPLPLELLLAVAKYFSPREAVKPSTVCRLWNHVFSAVVWRCYSINRFIPLSIEGLARNADHVRSLVCHGLLSLAPVCLAIPFTRLSSLSLDTGGKIPSGSKFWSQLADLVARNPQLQQLFIGAGGSVPPSEIGTSIASLPSLQSLSLDHFSTDLAHFATLWANCKRVEQLSIRKLTPLGNRYCMDAFWAGLEELQELKTISLDDTMTTPLLRFCPNLRSFQWQSYVEESDDCLNELAPLLANGQLRQLDSLHLSEVGVSQPLWLCLEAIHRIKQLVVMKGTVGAPFLLTLRRHFSTLEHLSLQVDNDVSSSMTQEILESCPLLTTLQVCRVKAADILKGKAWVCARLRVLRMDIDITSPEDQNIVQIESRAIFARLSKLVHLTEFDTRDSTYRGWKQGLDLRLESGLGQLSSLTQLTSLNFANTIQKMSTEDVAWVRKHWKYMRNFIGVCNKLGSLEDQPLHENILNAQVLFARCSGK